MTAIHDMSAGELLAAYKTKKLSPVEAIDAVITRIEAWEPRLKALYAPDFGEARKQAQAAEKRWQQGKPQGALDGVPITIKENIATKGVPVPLGTAATGLVPAAADAPGVAPMTRSVADSALLLAELSKPDARDHMSLPVSAIDWSAGPLEPKGLKIGLHLDAGSGLPVDAEVKAAVEAAAQLFEKAGAHIEPVAPFLSPDMLHLQDLFWRVRGWVDFFALTPAKQASVAPF